jgi:maleate cis-trans isomerase
MVVPPAWFNFCGRELRTLAPESVDSMTTQLRFDAEFGYKLEEIRHAAGEVEACVTSLAAAETEMIIQIGTPFSTVHGWCAGCELEANLGKRAGVPTMMMGLTLPRLFHALGLETATVCTVYYDEAWTRQYVDFLTEADVNVLYAGSFADHGAHQAMDILDTCHHVFDAAVLKRSVERICDLAPKADAVIISGMPCPMLELTAALEAAAGRPVISYVAMYAEILTTLGLPAPQGQRNVSPIGGGA